MNKLPDTLLSKEPGFLANYVKQNPDRVVVRESERYPGLWVVKYHRRVFYKNLWTPTLQELRGLVVDDDWNIVVYPFTKVYNRGERGTDFAAYTLVEKVEKINGFMAAVTPTQKYGCLISTTGSLDSPFVDMARVSLGNRVDGLSEGYTYIFEICDPQDPHIIEEKTGAYLIGARSLTTGAMMDQNFLDKVASDHHFMRPKWTIETFDRVLEDLKDCEIEGYMIYDSEGNALKLKSPYYLVNKLMARIRETKLETWLNSGRIKEIVDEEYYDLVDYVQENKEQFSEMSEQDRLKFMKDFLSE
jgi:hypothetical protein